MQSHYKITKMVCIYTDIGFNCNYKLSWCVQFWLLHEYLFLNRIWIWWSFLSCFENGTYNYVKTPTHSLAGGGEILHNMAQSLDYISVLNQTLRRKSWLSMPFLWAILHDPFLCWVTSHFMVYASNKALSFNLIWKLMFNSHSMHLTSGSFDLCLLCHFFDIQW